MQELKCSCGGDVRKVHNDYYDMDIYYQCVKCEKISRNIGDFYYEKTITEEIKEEKIKFLPDFDYDENNDVLYINFGIPEGACGNEVGNGTALFITPDGRYKGITIIDFKKRVIKNESNKRTNNK